ncbi:MAG TPA: hypothetical protein VM013_08960 [Dehalococcoidia bacterium]|nr:hypothetical protein [Dehalococcoidia bacterium]
MAKKSEISDVESGAPTCREALDHLRQSVANGSHWFPALLETVAMWQLPEETVGDRHYCYLVGGEAFDWILLAERLTESLDGAVPEAEREALLFGGRMPFDLDAEEFKTAIGAAKHTAHLNYLYGVTVEEALQLAVEEELHKERFAQCGTRFLPADEEVCRRIYGKEQRDLLERFREERGLPPSDDSIAYSDLKTFTYWLFKYRLRNCDRARVASDTRKALLQLSKLERARRRGQKRAASHTEQ